MFVVTSLWKFLSEILRCRSWQKVNFCIRTERFWTIIRENSRHILYLILRMLSSRSLYHWCFIGWYFFSYSVTRPFFKIIFIFYFFFFSKHISKAKLPKWSIPHWDAVIAWYALSLSDVQQRKKELWQYRPWN